MSTQATAYANLVGVAAAGTGAGTSGVTCASGGAAARRRRQLGRQPALQQGGEQARGRPAPCGSPMPLPGGAAALTQAQVDLIAAWIDGGALND